MSRHSLRQLRSWTPFAAIIAASTLPAACAFNTHGTNEGGGGTGTTTTTSSTTTTSATMTPCVPGEPKACYTGFPGTDGNGNCHAGTQTCKDDGTGYGPCTGEVVPANAESCDTPEDDNCNGMTNEGCACNPGDIQKCYTGPGATKGVGICHEGTQACGADHMWGACMGEALPGVEDCTTPDDEDCNGLAFDDAVAGCVCEPATNDKCDTGKLGACAVGTRVCNADGKGYGACSDTVQPKFDDCTTAADEDCDGAAPACTGNPGVAVGISGANADEVAFGVAADKDGSFVVGGVAGSLTNGFIVTAGTMLLAKYDKDGNPLWKNTPGAGGYAVARSVAVDSNGNVLTTGQFAGTLDVGNGKSITSNGSGGDTDGFVAKFDGAGTAQWIVRFGNNGAVQAGYGVAVDANDNVFVTGAYQGGINVNPSCNLGNSAGGFDAFVLKLDAAGTCKWGKKIGDGSDQEGRGIAVTPQNDIVVTGFFAGSMDFGGGALPSAGLSDVFVAKLSGSNGSHTWSKRYGDFSDQVAFGVAVDLNGDVAVTGACRGTIDFGNGALNGTMTADDVFVAKLAGSDGGPVWSKRFGDGLLSQLGTRVATDGAGNVVLAGILWGSANFGGANLTNADAANVNADVFVAKLAPDGTHLWSERYGDAADQRARDVAIDATGNVIIAGGFQGTMNLGAAGSITSAGAYDAFAVKLDP